MYSGPVTVGEFVEAGCDRPELLEAVEAAFDDVALARRDEDGQRQTRPSQARRTLVVNPPRDRPSA